MDQKQNKSSLIPEETLNKIIERIELGEPLTKICKDKSMPSLSVFYRYMRNDEKLQNKIRLARETGCFTIIDKINEELAYDVGSRETSAIEMVSIKISQ